MKRKVLQNPKCPICGFMVETNFHILWQCPGWVKLNWDAALNNQEGKYGGGVVIRDWAGNVLSMKCFSRNGTVSPYAAESFAALMAIDVCWENGYTHVHLEGDSKNLVNVVNCDEVD
jgi:ribonuclease HI